MYLNAIENIRPFWVIEVIYRVMNKQKKHDLIYMQSQKYKLDLTKTESFQYQL